MASHIDLPVELGDAIQLRTIDERDAGYGNCETCGEKLSFDRHITGTVRHHALGDTEYTDHRFCDDGCLREWIRDVRAAGGSVDWRARTRT